MQHSPTKQNKTKNPTEAKEIKQANEEAATDPKEVEVPATVSLPTIPVFKIHCIGHL